MDNDIVDNDKEFDFTKEAQLTNEKLAEKIAKLSPLDADEIRRKLPVREDRERFGKLIEMVNRAQSKNEKLAALEGNIVGLSEAAVKIIKKFLV